MKVFVKTSAIAADSFTVLPHGVVYIDEADQPRLAKRVAMLIQKFPKDICLYEGPGEGFDIKGSRDQALDAEADAEADAILAKAKAQGGKNKKAEEVKAKADVEKVEAEALAKKEADAEAETKSKENTTPQNPNAPQASRAK